jgi:tellurite resistance protein TerC
MSPIGFWIGFHIFLSGMLALDLGVFNRRAHVIGIQEALVWTAVWIGIAAIFNIGIYWLLGSRPALQFFTAYLIEKSLSVDNVFVFVMIFSYFHVPRALQHRVLFWGIIGALAARLIFILASVAVIQAFPMAVQRGAARSLE